MLCGCGRGFLIGIGKGVFSEFYPLWVSTLKPFPAEIEFVSVGVVQISNPACTRFGKGLGMGWARVGGEVLPFQSEQHMTTKVGSAVGYDLGKKTSSEEGVFCKGVFQIVHFLEILEDLEILENPQTMDNKEESDHVLEILENSEIFEILEIPPVKRPLSQ